ncbi:hypothetical protein V6N11_075141 [Hibiscus sabdariffa]|uniref:RRM domain-containing protein n=1 Tax=Hibiscus sabdariffa TaxID=183260 RepID=A0ABR2R5T6_9ROSI
MRRQLGGEFFYQDRRPNLRNQTRRDINKNRVDQGKSFFSCNVGSQRSGFSVFVNFVSKRIHPSTLREAFSVYDRVVGVFIAFNNPKRLKFRSTFAFVRFASLEEAEKAVRLGTNRKMDGFYIKVFMENNIGMSSSMPKAAGNFSKMYKSNASKFPARVKEGLSYKDALLKKGGVEKSRSIETASSGHDLKLSDHHIGVMSNKEVEKFSFDIHPKVYEWLSNCLVCQVKGMYDADFVQQVLVAGGFKVKVCVWSGYFVLLYFDEEEHMEIFRDLKEAMLESWFVSIDSYYDFTRLNKLKIWVVLDGFPIEAWHEDVFVSMANSWGSFVKLDEDTASKSRLDSARILISVSSVSVFPQQVAISVKGSGLEFQQWSSKTIDDGLIRISHAAQSTSRTDCVEVSGLGKDDPKAHLMSSINSPLHIGLTNSENLMEVPICEQLESNSSSENCLSIEPVFTAVTGLYSIKTKYLKNAWQSSSPSLKFQLPGSTVGGAPNLEAKSNSANIFPRSKSKSLKDEKLLVEAKEALEVCKSLGLIF